MFNTMLSYEEAYSSISTFIYMYYTYTLYTYLLHITFANMRRLSHNSMSRTENKLHIFWNIVIFF